MKMMIALLLFVSLYSTVEGLVMTNSQGVFLLANHTTIGGTLSLASVTSTTCVQDGVVRWNGDTKILQLCIENAWRDVALDPLISGLSMLKPATSCTKILKETAKMGMSVNSGVFWLKDTGASFPRQALCRFDSDGSAWRLLAWTDGSDVSHVQKSSVGQSPCVTGGSTCKEHDDVINSILSGSGVYVFEIRPHDEYVCGKPIENNKRRTKLPFYLRSSGNLQGPDTWDSSILGTFASVFSGTSTTWMVSVYPSFTDALNGTNSIATDGSGGGYLPSASPQVDVLWGSPSGGIQSGATWGGAVVGGLGGGLWIGEVEDAPRTHGADIFHPASSCQDVFDSSEGEASDGHYWIELSNRNDPVRLWCSMTIADRPPGLLAMRIGDLSGIHATQNEATFGPFSPLSTATKKASTNDISDLLRLQDEWRIIEIVPDDAARLPMFLSSRGVNELWPENLLCSESNRNALAANSSLSWVMWTYKTYDDALVGRDGVMGMYTSSSAYSFPNAYRYALGGAQIFFMCSTGGIRSVLTYGNSGHISTLTGTMWIYNLPKGTPLRGTVGNGGSDCLEIQQAWQTASQALVDGVYWLYFPTRGASAPVYCRDMNGNRPAALVNVVAEDAITHNQPGLLGYTTWGGYCVANEGDDANCKMSADDITDLLQRPGRQIVSIEMDDPTYGNMYVASNDDADVWPADTRSQLRPLLVADETTRWIIGMHPTMEDAELGSWRVEGTYEAANEYAYPLAYRFDKGASAQRFFVIGTGGMRSTPTWSNSGYSDHLLGSVWVHTVPDARGGKMRGTDRLLPATSCLDAYQNITGEGATARDGLYHILPTTGSALKSIYCSMTGAHPGEAFVMRIAATSFEHSNPDAIGTLCVPSDAECKLSTAEISELLHNPGVHAVSVVPDNTAYLAIFCRSDLAGALWLMDPTCDNRPAILADPNKAWILTVYHSWADAMTDTNAILSDYSGGSFAFPTAYTGGGAPGAQIFFQSSTGGMRSVQTWGNSGYANSLPGTCWVY